MPPGIGCAWLRWIHKSIRWTRNCGADHWVPIDTSGDRFREECALGGSTAGGIRRYCNPLDPRRLSLRRVLRQVYDAKIRVLGEMVKQHIKEEEDELFPEVESAKMDVKAVPPRIPFPLSRAGGLIGDAELIVKRHDQCQTPLGSFTRGHRMDKFGSVQPNRSSVQPNRSKVPRLRPIVHCVWS